jgi:predicted Zn finger-like uncharacterized protein
MEEKIILECYRCSAQFKITPSLLGPQGKKVRCARCKHEWIAKAPLEDTRSIDILSAEDTQPILPGTTSSLMADSAKKEKLFYRAPLETKSILLSNVFLLLVLLFTIPSFLYIGRYKIADLIPHSRVLYNRAGIDVGEDLKAFSLSDLSHTQALQNGASTIIVRGTLTNTTKKIATTPNVLITLYGTGDCPPITWKDKLLKGEFMDQEDGYCTLEQWAVQINDREMLPSQNISIETSHPIHPKWNIKHVFLDLARR